MIHDWEKENYENIRLLKVNYENRTIPCVDVRVNSMLTNIIAWVYGIIALGK